MLNVGSVIYLLDKKTQSLVPCMVVEKVKSVTLEGENTHHIVVTPTEQRVRLENYKAPWFENVESAKEFLVEAALSLINKTVEKAVNAAEKSFNLNSQPDLEASAPDDSFQANVPSLESVSDVVVDLGDGQTAKVSISPEAM